MVHKSFYTMSSAYSHQTKCYYKIPIFQGSKQGEYFQTAAVCGRTPS